MSEFITIHGISAYLGREITLRGWVFNIRSSGKICFLQFRDGTGFLQIVAVKNDIRDDELWSRITTLSMESSVIVMGIVTEDARSPIGVELQLRGLKIVQSAAEYPIAKKEHGPEFLLDNRHLWLRSSKQWAIQRVRNTVINAIYSYLNESGFIKIDAPILTPNACEGTTELFSIDYFNEKAYLSQSGQLYLEAAIMSFGRVFDFGPVFRAEKSKTRRHLTEFWMMDAEAAFVEHEANMMIQEGLVGYIVKRVLDKNRYELQLLDRDISKLEAIVPPFIRMSYADAVKELQSLGSDIKDGEDLGADDETLLTGRQDKPIFVEKYPIEVKAFYMKRDPKDSRYVLGSDMLAPEGYGEIIGGSQREDDYDTLLQRIREHNLSEDDFSWYLDLRKFGSVPHSGFGVGLERMITWICGIRHVRETIPFPRLINRLRP